MATVPITRTAVAGEVTLAAHFNANIRDVLNFLLAPPIFELRQTAAQTLTTGVWTALTFDVEDLDSAGGHSTVTNTSRYTAVYPGWYQYGGGYGTAANAGGVRGTRPAVNGTTLNGGNTLEVGSANATAYPSRTKHIFLNVTDYAELQAFQSSGGNLATAITADQQSSNSGRWVSN